MPTEDYAPEQRPGTILVTEDGIEMWLDARRRLYAGVLPGCPGCCLALYTGADRALIGIELHAAEARKMIEAVAMAIQPG